MSVIIATRDSYVGIFLISLATLLYEMLLTRIFSVTLWYHFAFMAISIAMFGLTCGALIVHFKSRSFSKEKAHARLSLCSWIFSIAILFSVLAHTFVQSILAPLSLSIAWTLYVMLTFPLMAIPFIFSGIVITIALTKFPSQVSSLYASDLLGASCGCLLLAGLLSMTDCFTAIVAVAASGSAAAYYFSLPLSEAAQELSEDPDPVASEKDLDTRIVDNTTVRRNKLGLLASVSCALMLVLASAQLVLSKHNMSLLKAKFVKGSMEIGPAYEKWNSFSRIRIFGDGFESSPLGWGLSQTLDKNYKVRQLSLNIDGAAGTVLTAYDGDKSKIQHLLYDVTNIGHYLRKNADVLVIGVGGGRDLLSALAFNQKSVTGVEINQDIIDAVMNKFGNFTGHLDRVPGVKVVNDEAKSYIARSKDKFDMIQVSLIDTWASSTAGGLSLTENSLYTLESWKIFLNHLTPRGILSFSRWCGEPPTEVLKLLVLANKALSAVGVSDPPAHIIVVKGDSGFQGIPPVATVLVSIQPFSKDDIEEMKKVAEQMKFEALLYPGGSDSTQMATLAANPDALISSLNVNVAAPTDDCPYFFQMMPAQMLPKSIFDLSAINHAGNAIVALFWLLIFVIWLSLLCIYFPSSRFASKFRLPQYEGKVVPFLLYFISIGLAYMLIEIAQMQRLSGFLGHPSYSLTVILFSLLISGGVGSLSTQKNCLWLNEEGRMISLLLSVLVTGLLTPVVCSIFQTQETPVRITLSVLLTLPMGFFMGMAFPLGLKLASAVDDDLGAWLWGLNGAAAVCASVIAVILALLFGISTAFFTGVFFYFLAAILFLRLRKTSA